MTVQANTRSVMTTGNWFITIFLTLIVPIGFIMLFFWVMNPSTNENKANYAKAVLMLYGMLFTVYLSYIIIFGMAIFQGMSNM